MIWMPHSLCKPLKGIWAISSLGFSWIKPLHALGYWFCMNLSFYLLGWMSKSAIAGPCSKCMFRCFFVFFFFRNWPSIFQHGWSILRSYSMILYPRQHFVLALFFILAILRSLTWSLIVVLTCISIAANNVEQLCHVCTLSSEMPAHFLIGLFGCLNNLSFCICFPAKSLFIF